MSITIDVQANNLGWNETSIQLNKGQEFEIAVPNDIIKDNGTTVPNDIKVGRYAHEQHIDYQGFLDQAKKPKLAPADCLVEGLNWFGLIAKIGNGPAFNVESGVKHTANADGYLKFAINASKNRPASYFDRFLRVFFIGFKELTGPEGSGAFGFAVAIRGNTAVVGDPFRIEKRNNMSGAAYVFHRDGDGNWGSGHKLDTGIDNMMNYYFGWSVGINEDEKTIVVGAPRNSSNRQSDVGSVHIFSLDSTSANPKWEQKKELTGKEAKGLFGTSVAISNNTIVVGASGPYHHTAGVEQFGNAYVFSYQNNTWNTPGIELKDPYNIPSATMSAGFGHSVAISGDKIVVGNYKKSKAYVYSRQNNSWGTTGTELTENDGHHSDQFGYGVAVSGDTIVVGAPGAEVDHKVSKNHGLTYVFLGGSSGDWPQDGPHLTAHDAAQLDWFGWSVAINENKDKIIVGARFATHEGKKYAGSAYVFGRDQNQQWHQLQELISDQDLGDQKGYGVGVSGDTGIVGLPGANIARTFEL